jgi:rfaE bifunctional protein kinase chain/domain/rfaE bifunctional protein nucleotidyltransferase chain/domain
MNINNKIIDLDNLTKIIKNFNKKKKIGLCHGVFDLLHIGHIKHFDEAKKNCDILIVSITQDKFVAKGPGRPAFNDQQRMEALASLEFVDYVVLSNNSSSIEVINKIKPNIYFKGPDYKNTKLDITGKILLENKAVIKNKGKIFITKSRKYSSSLLLNSFTEIQTQEQKNLKKKILQKFNFEKIKKIINDFRYVNPLVIGELIIDQYFFCEALGKSGKEPILVLRDKYNESYLGGAAAICRHISEFCKNIYFLSTIGEKKQNLNFIKKNLPKNVKYFFLNKKNSPTIIKKRFLDEITKSKILGVYSLEDSFVSKKEEANLIRNFSKFLKNSDLTILSDYGHGMISKNFSKIIKKKSKFIAVNVQINASNIGYHSLQNYKSVDFMIINEGELRHEMRSKNENIFNLAKELANNFKIKYLAVTRGSNGSFLYEKNKNIFYKSDALAKIVLDKVGAGDAMLSILAICLYKKIDINLSLLIASLAAAQSVRTMGNKFSISKNTLLKELEHFLS